ncbi:MAG: hypothetical protein OEY14_16490, partial [Myxococcales bacterium]|nr:hypothetical protein [Myxococcales bacterium]
MDDFATLPFEEQLGRLRACLEGEGEPIALLRAAAGLADAEPFARFVGDLADAGRLDEALLAELDARIASLPDASLLHLFEGEGSIALQRLRSELAEAALQRWPLARISGLTLLRRWLGLHAPERLARLEARAEERSRAPIQAEGTPTWLLLLGGESLEALRGRPGGAAIVDRAVHEALEALGRAPKSISQANAERLLARSVYADPGHFFFELMQNADDAGARAFSAEIGASGVELRHDGRPFSFA